jgi:hypothetical protein
MTDDQTSVSWKAIEPHWKVYAADGLEIGEVFQVEGDENADIFDGLAITHRGGPAALHGHLDRPRYVRFDKVASIEPGLVRLTIKAAEVAQLPENKVAESLEILPEKASLVERLEGEITHLTHKDHTN